MVRAIHTGGPGSPFRVLVIGGGVAGLATLADLCRRGVSPVGLVERFEPRHEMGGSHGPSRIMRTTYAEPRYTRLARVARTEDWPRLEAGCGQPLIHPTPGCFLGPPGPVFDRYAAALADEEYVDLLDAETAEEEFPQFRFDGMAGAFRDRSAGVIDSDATMSALREAAGRAGAKVLHGFRVTGIDRDGEIIVVQTDRGDLHTEKVVVCVGAWTGSLLPDLRPRPVAIRQTVVHVDVEADAEALAPGRFPVWAFLGNVRDVDAYGLPVYGRPGLKLARHVVAGRQDDPDAPPTHPEDEELARLTSLVASRLKYPLVEVLSASHCIYACTPSHDFVLDLLPGDARVVVGTGFSGHGFKFAPLLGRILGGLATDGTTDVPEFETEREAFSIRRA